MIKRIISVRIVRHFDNCQTTAYVDFILDNGQRGFTSGAPDSNHVSALITRAEAEGAPMLWESIAPHAGEGEV